MLKPNNRVNVNREKVKREPMVVGQVMRDGRFVTLYRYGSKVFYLRQN